MILSLDISFNHIIVYKGFCCYSRKGFSRVDEKNEEKMEDVSKSPVSYKISSEEEIEKIVV